MTGEEFLCGCQRNSGVRFKAIREQRTPASGTIQVQASHVECAQPGLLRNQIPFLGGKWSLSWHLVGWGWGTSLETRGRLNSMEAYCPSYSGHLRAGDVVASLGLQMVSK